MNIGSPPLLFQSEIRSFVLSPRKRRLLTRPWLGEFEMAKRRERRMPPSSNRREDGVESSKPTTRRGGDSAPSPQINIVLFLIVVIAPAVAVLVYRTKYAPVTSRILSAYVHQQGLVKADVNYQEILTVSAGFFFLSLFYFLSSQTEDCEYILCFWLLLIY